MITTEKVTRYVLEDPPKLVRHILTRWEKLITSWNCSGKTSLTSSMTASLKSGILSRTQTFQNMRSISRWTLSLKFRVRYWYLSRIPDRIMHQLIWGISYNDTGTFSRQKHVVYGELLCHLTVVQQWWKYQQRNPETCSSSCSVLVSIGS